MVPYPFQTGVTMAMSRQRRLHLAVNGAIEGWTGGHLLVWCRILPRRLALWSEPRLRWRDHQPNIFIFIFIFILSTEVSNVADAWTVRRHWAAKKAYRRRHPRRPHRRHEHHHHHHDRRYHHPIIIAISIIINAFVVFCRKSLSIIIVIVIIIIVIIIIIIVIVTIIVILNNIWGRRWCNSYFLSLINYFILITLFLAKAMQRRSG